MLELDHKIESAFAQLLAAYSATTGIENVYRGQDSEEFLIPRIVISSQSGHEDPPFSGNRLSDVKIAVISTADVEEDPNLVTQIDPVEKHRERCKKVFDLAKEFITQLSTVEADLHVFRWLDMGLEHSHAQRHFGDALNLQLYACGAKVNP